MISAVFAGLTIVTDRLTDRPRYSICNNRLHLCMYYYYYYYYYICLNGLFQDNPGKLAPER